MIDKRRRLWGNGTCVESPFPNNNLEMFIFLQTKQISLSRRETISVAHYWKRMIRGEKIAVPKLMQKRSLKKFNYFFVVNNGKPRSNTEI